MLPLGQETAVQAVVGSIVWAFRRLKKPRCREMSARGYALHSVCPQLSFFLFFHSYPSNPPTDLHLMKIRSEECDSVHICCSVNEVSISHIDPSMDNVAAQNDFPNDDNKRSTL